MHEARKVRDAERRSPGIIRKTLSEQLSNGEAPTRAAIKRAIEAEARRRTAKHFRAARRHASGKARASASTV